MTTSRIKIAKLMEREKALRDSKSFMIAQKEISSGTKLKDSLSTGTTEGVDDLRKRASSPPPKNELASTQRFPSPVDISDSRKRITRVNSPSRETLQYEFPQKSVVASAISQKEHEISMQMNSSRNSDSENILDSPSRRRRKVIQGPDEEMKISPRSARKKASRLLTRSLSPDISRRSNNDRLGPISRKVLFDDDASGNWEEKINDDIRAVHAHVPISKQRQSEEVLEDIIALNVTIMSKSNIIDIANCVKAIETKMKLVDIDFVQYWLKFEGSYRNILDINRQVSIEAVDEILNRYPGWNVSNRLILSKTDPLYVNASAAFLSQDLLFSSNHSIGMFFNTSHKESRQVDGILIAVAGTSMNNNWDSDNAKSLRDPFKLQMKLLLHNLSSGIFQALNSIKNEEILEEISRSSKEVGLVSSSKDKLLTLCRIAENSTLSFQSLATQTALAAAFHHDSKSVFIQMQGFEGLDRSYLYEINSWSGLPGINYSDILDRSSPIVQLLQSFKLLCSERVSITNPTHKLWVSKVLGDTSDHSHATVDEIVVTSFKSSSSIGGRENAQSVDKRDDSVYILISNHSIRISDSITLNHLTELANITQKELNKLNQRRKTVLLENLSLLSSRIYEATFLSSRFDSSLHSEPSDRKIITRVMNTIQSQQIAKLLGLGKIQLILSNEVVRNVGIPTNSLDEKHVSFYCSAGTSVRELSSVSFVLSETIWLQNLFEGKVVMINNTLCKDTQDESSIMNELLTCYSISQARGSLIGFLSSIYQEMRSAVLLPIRTSKGLAFLALFDYSNSKDRRIISDHLRDNNNVSFDKNFVQDIQNSDLLSSIGNVLEHLYSLEMILSSNMETRNDLKCLESLAVRNHDKLECSKYFNLWKLSSIARKRDLFAQATVESCSFLQSCSSAEANSELWDICKEFVQKLFPFDNVHLSFDDNWRAENMNYIAYRLPIIALPSAAIVVTRSSKTFSRLQEKEFYALCNVFSGVFSSFKNGVEWSQEICTAMCHATSLTNQPFSAESSTSSDVLNYTCDTISSLMSGELVTCNLTKLWTEALGDIPETLFVSNPNRKVSSFVADSSNKIRHTDSDSAELESKIDFDPEKHLMTISIEHPLFLSKGPIATFNIHLNDKQMRSIDSELCRRITMAVTMNLQLLRTHNRALQREKELTVLKNEYDQLKSGIDTVKSDLQSADKAITNILAEKEFLHSYVVASELLFSATTIEDLGDLIWQYFPQLFGSRSAILLIRKAFAQSNTFSKSESLQNEFEIIWPRSKQSLRAASDLAEGDISYDQLMQMPRYYNNSNTEFTSKQASMILTVPSTHIVYGSILFFSPSGTARYAQYSATVEAYIGSLVHLMIKNIDYKGKLAQAEVYSEQLLDRAKGFDNCENGNKKLLAEVDQLVNQLKQEKASHTARCMEYEESVCKLSNALEASRNDAQTSKDSLLKAESKIESVLSIVKAFSFDERCSKDSESLFSWLQDFLKMRNIKCFPIINDSCSDNKMSANCLPEMLREVPGLFVSIGESVRTKKTISLSSKQKSAVSPFGTQESCPDIVIVPNVVCCDSDSNDDVSCFVFCKLNAWHEESVDLRGEDVATVEVAVNMVCRMLQTKKLAISHEMMNKFEDRVATYEASFKKIGNISYVCNNLIQSNISTADDLIQWLERQVPTLLGKESATEIASDTTTAGISCMVVLTNSLFRKEKSLLRAYRNMMEAMIATKLSQKTLYSILVPIICSEGDIRGVIVVEKKPGGSDIQRNNESMSLTSIDSLIMNMLASMAGSILDKIHCVRDAFLCIQEASRAIAVVQDSKQGSETKCSMEVAKRLELEESFKIGLEMLQVAAKQRLQISYLLDILRRSILTASSSQDCYILIPLQSLPNVILQELRVSEAIIDSQMFALFDGSGSNKVIQLNSDDLEMISIKTHRAVCSDPILSATDDLGDPVLYRHSSWALRQRTQLSKQTLPTPDGLSSAVLQYSSISVPFSFTLSTGIASKEAPVDLVGAVVSVRQIVPFHERDRLCMTWIIRSFSVGLIRSIESEIINATQIKLFCAEEQIKELLEEKSRFRLFLAERSAFSLGIAKNPSLDNTIQYVNKTLMSLLDTTSDSSSTFENASLPRMTGTLYDHLLIACVKVSFSEDASSLSVRDYRELMSQVKEIKSWSLALGTRGSVDVLFLQRFDSNPKPATTPSSGHDFSRVTVLFRVITDSSSESPASPLYYTFNNNEGYNFVDNDSFVLRLNLFVTLLNNNLQWIDNSLHFITKIISARIENTTEKLKYSEEVTKKSKDVIEIEETFHKRIESEREGFLQLSTFKKMKREIIENIGFIWSNWCKLVSKGSSSFEGLISSIEIHKFSEFFDVSIGKIALSSSPSSNSFNSRESGESQGGIEWIKSTSVAVDSDTFKLIPLAESRYRVIVLGEDANVLNSFIHNCALLEEDSVLHDIHVKVMVQSGSPNTIILVAPNTGLLRNDILVVSPSAKSPYRNSKSILIAMFRMFLSLCITTKHFDDIRAAGETAIENRIEFKKLEKDIAKHKKVVSFQQMKISSYHKKLETFEELKTSASSSASKLQVLENLLADWTEIVKSLNGASTGAANGVSGLWSRACGSLVSMLSSTHSIAGCGLILQSTVRRDGYHGSHLEEFVVKDFSTPQSHSFHIGNAERFYEYSDANLEQLPIDHMNSTSKELLSQLFDDDTTKNRCFRVGDRNETSTYFVPIRTPRGVLAVIRVKLGMPRAELHSNLQRNEDSNFKTTLINFAEAFAPLLHCSIIIDGLEYDREQVNKQLTERTGILDSVSGELDRVNNSLSIFKKISSKLFNGLVNLTWSNVASSETALSESCKFIVDILSEVFRCELEISVYPQVFANVLNGGDETNNLQVHQIESYEVLRFSSKGYSNDSFIDNSKFTTTVPLACPGHHRLGDLHFQYDSNETQLSVELIARATANITATVLVAAQREALAIRDQSAVALLKTTVSKLEVVNHHTEQWRQLELDCFKLSTTAAAAAPNSNSTVSLSRDSQAHFVSKPLKYSLLKNDEIFYFIENVLMRFIAFFNGEISVNVALLGSVDKTDTDVNLALDSRMKDILWVCGDRYLNKTGLSQSLSSDKLSDSSKAIANNILSLCMMKRSEAEIDIRHSLDATVDSHPSSSTSSQVDLHIHAIPIVYELTGDVLGAVQVLSFVSERAMGTMSVRQAHHEFAQLLSLLLSNTIKDKVFKATISQIEGDRTGLEAANASISRLSGLQRTIAANWQILQRMGITLMKVFGSTEKDILNPKYLNSLLKGSQLIVKGLSESEMRQASRGARVISSDAMGSIVAKALIATGNGEGLEISYINNDGDGLPSDTARHDSAVSEHAHQVIEEVMHLIKTIVHIREKVNKLSTDVSALQKSTDSVQEYNRVMMVRIQSFLSDALEAVNRVAATESVVRYSIPDLIQATQPIERLGSIAPAFFIQGVKLLDIALGKLLNPPDSFHVTLFVRPKLVTQTAQHRLVYSESEDFFKVLMFDRHVNSGEGVEVSVIRDSKLRKLDKGSSTSFAERGSALERAFDSTTAFADIYTSHPSPADLIGVDDPQFREFDKDKKELQIAFAGIKLFDARASDVVIRVVRVVHKLSFDGASKSGSSSVISRQLSLDTIDSDCRDLELLERALRGSSVRSALQQCAGVFESILRQTIHASEEIRRSEVVHAEEDQEFVTTELLKQQLTRYKKLYRIVSRESAMLLDPPVIGPGGAVPRAAHPSSLTPIAASQDACLKILSIARSLLRSEGQAVILRDATTNPISYQIIFSGDAIQWQGIAQNTFGTVFAPSSDRLQPQRHQQMSLVETVIATRKTLAVPNISKDDRYYFKLDGVCAPETPLLLVPIRGRGSGVIGVLVAARGQEGRPFDIEDISAAELLSAMGGLSLYWCQGLGSVYHQLVKTAGKVDQLERVLFREAEEEATTYDDSKPRYRQVQKVEQFVSTTSAASTTANLTQTSSVAVR